MGVSFCGGRTFVIEISSEVRLMIITVSISLSSSTDSAVVARKETPKSPIYSITDWANVIHFNIIGTLEEVHRRLAEKSMMTTESLRSSFPVPRGAFSTAGRSSDAHALLCQFEAVQHHEAQFEVRCCKSSGFKK